MSFEVILGAMVYLAIAIFIQEWLEKECGLSKFKSAILALIWPGTFVTLVILGVIIFLYDMIL